MTGFFFVFLLEIPAIMILLHSIAVRIPIAKAW